MSESVLQDERVSCACGCGEETKNGNLYIHGHNWKNKKHSLRAKILIALANTGENNHGWKGGRVLSNGYVYVLAKDHPCCNSGGRVAEHRLIMEKYIGRYLNPEEVVHHINGIVDDNRKENLKLFAGAEEHSRLHNLGKKTGKPAWNKGKKLGGMCECSLCGKMHYKARCRIHQKHKFCSRKCRNGWNRKIKYFGIHDKGGQK